jgi:hypothetical protein
MSEKPQRPLEYIDVPADTRPSQCRAPSCKATIYWIERESTNKKTPGKIVKVPVDCEHNEQCVAPTSEEAGIGVNHFMTCADANRF